MTIIKRISEEMSHLPDISGDTIFAGLKDVFVYKISTITKNLPVLFCADGSGGFIESHTHYTKEKGSQKLHKVVAEFSHQEDIKALSLMDKDSLDEKMFSLIKDEINPYINDPFLLDGDEENYSDEMNNICFGASSQKEFDALVYLISAAHGKDMRDKIPYEIRFLSSSEKLQHECCFDDTGTDVPINQVMCELLDVACEIHEFTGYESVYNDGAYDRKSGFDDYPHSYGLWIEDKMSAHDTMAATDKLREIFSQHGHSYDDIIEDIAERSLQ